MIVSLQVYTDANDKDMRKRGIPTTKDLLYKILEMLTGHVEKDRRNQAAMGQNTRRLVQEPLRMGWYHFHARVLCPVCRQLDAMA